MEVLLTKTLQGYLVPVSEDEAEKLRRIKAGATVRADIVQMRNGAFFRKFWALLKLAYDIWSEREGTLEYRGQRVLADFDRFRRDVIILAGFYTPVYNIKGEVRLEPESLRWGHMTEDRFNELYSKTIDVVLQKVIPQAGYDEDSLRAAVENVMGFA